MTEATAARTPEHLRRFVVDQNYARYTDEDQATWRFVMHQLRDYLGTHAHHAYASGLSKVGIDVDRIPSIEDIDQRLSAYGWGAVPVAGFIPPAAFMEFQSIGVLPIASDVRSAEHWLYTPAPDIIHEAAGHAPLLVHEGYSEFLRHYGEIARHSIISRDDLDQYDAIKVLSDLKEDARSTPEQVTAAEDALDAVNARVTDVSEATLLSRMNWWTAEYGLIGSLESPRLFGAGLLSSVGEARTCLEARVKKIPLTVDCVNYAYDITEPQPHLFVTPDFESLSPVLDQLADRLSYRRGGKHGLQEAIRARTVNSVVLDSGAQISGVLTSYETDARGGPAYLKFEGPGQLAVDYVELPGQGRARHAHGYSCPVGPLADDRNLSDFDRAMVAAIPDRLEYASGVVVTGKIKHAEFVRDRLIYLTWTDCTVVRGDQRLFEPAWGEYDQAAGARVTSVFGGPADRAAYGDDDGASSPKDYSAPARSPADVARFALYAEVRLLRETGRGDFPGAVARYFALAGDEWLLGLELLEHARARGIDAPELEARLDPKTRRTSTTRVALALGRRLIKR